MYLEYGINTFNFPFVRCVLKLLAVVAWWAISINTNLFDINLGRIYVVINFLYMCMYVKSFSTFQTPMQYNNCIASFDILYVGAQKINSNNFAKKLSHIFNYFLPYLFSQISQQHRCIGMSRILQSLPIPTNRFIYILCQWDITI